MIFLMVSSRMGVGGSDSHSARQFSSSSGPQNSVGQHFSYASEPGLEDRGELLAISSFTPPTQNLAGQHFSIGGFEGGGRHRARIIRHLKFHLGPPQPIFSMRPGNGDWRTGRTEPNGSSSSDPIQGDKQ
jgi:hypothetical protein